MKKIKILVLFIAFGFAVANLQANEISQKELNKILVKVDLYKAPHAKKSFVINLQIKSYRVNKKTIFRQLRAINSSKKSLIIFEKPVKEKNRAILDTGDKSLWFKIPKRRRIVRLSPAQRMIGQVNMQDILTTRFATDYDIVSSKILPNSNRLFRLKSNDKRNLYKIIELEINTNNFKPIISRHYAVSGRLLKISEYKEFKKFRGKTLVSKVVLKDDIKKNDYSVITYTDYKIVKISKKMFSKQYLNKI